MKKLFLLAAVLFSIPVFSQSADERIGTLINQSDWFGLEENYPILKDSMQVDFLKLMSEIMIDYNFNRPDKAISGIRKLLTNHQNEIGGSTLVGSFTFSISIGTDTSQSGRVILGAGTSFMSERFAKEVGVRILNDSLTINSTLPGAMNGQMGTVENMQIGSMIFHYPLITVAPPNALDSVMRVDAILGMDFINLFDELRIYPKEKKIVFPVSCYVPKRGAV